MSANWDVRAVCDIDPTRLAKAARPYPGLRTTASFEEVLGNSDIAAVAIATPVETHHALVKAALEAGKHVLVEKPLTSTAKEGSALCDLADRLGLVLMVDHTFLFTSPVEYLKKYIADGELGAILYVDTVRVNLGLFQAVANVILDLAPHDISILNYLLGSVPIEVAANVSRCIDPQIADVAYLTIRYPNNILAHAHLSWLSPVKIRRMNIAARSKMVVWDDVETDRIRIYDKGVEVARDPEQRIKDFVRYRSGNMIAPALDNTEPLSKLVDEFFHVIVDGAACRSTGRDGLEVVRVLEAAELSMQYDGWFFPIEQIPV